MTINSTLKNRLDLPEQREVTGRLNTYGIAVTPPNLKNANTFSQISQTIELAGQTAEKLGRVKISHDEAKNALQNGDAAKEYSNIIAKVQADYDSGKFNEVIDPEDIINNSANILKKYSTASDREVNDKIIYNYSGDFSNILLKIYRNNRQAIAKDMAVGCIAAVSTAKTLEQINEQLNLYSSANNISQTQAISEIVLPALNTAAATGGEEAGDKIDLYKTVLNGLYDGEFVNAVNTLALTNNRIKNENRADTIDQYYKLTKDINTPYSTVLSFLDDSKTSGNITNEDYASLKDSAINSFQYRNYNKLQSNILWGKIDGQVAIDEIKRRNNLNPDDPYYLNSNNAGQLAGMAVSAQQADVSLEEMNLALNGDTSITLNEGMHSKSQNSIMDTGGIVESGSIIKGLEFAGIINTSGFISKQNADVLAACLDSPDNTIASQAFIALATLSKSQARQNVMEKLNSKSDRVKAYSMMAMLYSDDIVNPSASNSKISWIRAQVDNYRPTDKMPSAYISEEWDDEWEYDILQKAMNKDSLTGQTRLWLDFLNIDEVGETSPAILSELDTICGDMYKLNRELGLTIGQAQDITEAYLTGWARNHIDFISWDNDIIPTRMPDAFPAELWFKSNTEELMADDLESEGFSKDDVISVEPYMSKGKYGWAFKGIDGSYLVGKNGKQILYVQTGDEEIKENEERYNKKHPKQSNVKDEPEIGNWYPESYGR